MKHWTVTIPGRWILAPLLSLLTWEAWSKLVNLPGPLCVARLLLVSLRFLVKIGYGAIRVRTGDCDHLLHGEKSWCAELNTSPNEEWGSLTSQLVHWTC